MTRQAGAILLIAICALSLALHFAVESRMEIQGRPGNGNSLGAFDMHEGDQFVLEERGNDHSTGLDLRIPCLPDLIIFSCTLTPLLQPPIAG